MKVRDLITELGRYNQDSDVALSSDAEGNSIRGYEGVSEEFAYPMEYGQYDTVAEEDLDDDWQYDQDPPERILVLWPI